MLTPVSSNQLAQMTTMARLEMPDRFLKDIVYLLITNGKAQRICSSQEDF